MMTSSEEIHNRFSYHPPNPDQTQRYERIREVAKSLAFTIHYLCPESREASMALTKLDEVVMHANAAIARRG